MTPGQSQRFETSKGGGAKSPGSASTPEPNGAHKEDFKCRSEDRELFLLQKVQVGIRTYESVRICCLHWILFYELPVLRTSAQRSPSRRTNCPETWYSASRIKFISFVARSRRTESRLCDPFRAPFAVFNVQPRYRDEESHYPPGKLSTQRKGIICVSRGWKAGGISISRKGKRDKNYMRWCWAVEGGKEGGEVFTRERILS